jgi:nucleotide-binding universal stress UspA family protein
VTTQRKGGWRRIVHPTDFSLAADAAFVQALAIARQSLERLLAKTKRQEVAASAVVVEGWPPEEIVKLARKRRAALIVIGTHGRTGVKRLLLGSVAERVIVLAPCPVLAVRRT